MAYNISIINKKNKGVGNMKKETKRNIILTHVRELKEMLDNIDVENATHEELELTFKGYEFIRELTNNLYNKDFIEKYL